MLTLTPELAMARPKKGEWKMGTGAGAKVSKGGGSTRGMRQWPVPTLQ